MRLLSSLAIALLLGASIASLAASPAAAAPNVSDENLDLAKRHFQSGSAYFEEARFDEAAREFRESYRLAPKVDLLYNIAQCYLRKGDAARAIDFFRQYLEGKPDAADRAPIERTVGDLRDHVGKVKVAGAPEGAEVVVAGWSFGRAPLAEPVAVTVGRARVEARLADGSVRSTEVKVQPDEVVEARIPEPVLVQEKVVEKVVERGGPRWWDDKLGWAVAGTGAGLLLAGALVAGPGASAVAGGARNSTTESGWRQVRSNAQSMEIAGIVTAAVGAAGLAAGAAIFAVHARRAPVTASVWVSPDSAGVYAHGAF